MIPDGDRRHDPESGRVVNKIQLVLVRHQNVMTEFILCDHVFDHEPRIMMEEPVQDVADRVLGRELASEPKEELIPQPRRFSIVMGSSISDCPRGNLTEGRLRGVDYLPKILDTATLKPGRCGSADSS